MTASPRTSTELPKRLPFLDARAKSRATEAVRAFEKQTSAELVITVRKRARAYPEIELRFALVFGFVALLILLFFPVDFAVAYMPVDVALAGLAGFALARLLPSSSRLFVSKERRREGAGEAAKAAFYDLGVTRTKDRTGVLVYVALLEGVVVIVPDSGVSPEAKAAAESAQASLETALKLSDVSAFAEALEALGPRFANTMPRAADDENELPDEIA